MKLNLSIRLFGLVVWLATSPSVLAQQTSDKPTPQTESRTTAPQSATTAHADPKPPIVVAPSTVVTVNVRYKPSGEDPLHVLDIYAPRDAKQARVFVFIHGGGWSGRDKDEVGSQPKLFNTAGIIVVSINYRLAPAVQHPANVQDVAASIAWIHSNIKSYGGDPSKIYIMGHSAGSHLAALVATDDRYLSAHGLHRNQLAGVVCLDGSAFDIPHRIKNGTEKIAENCRRAFGDDEAVQNDGSPVSHVKGSIPLPRFLLIYLQDGSLNQVQSQKFAELVRATGGTAKLVQIDGKTHQSLCDDLGTDNNDIAGPMLVDFVRLEQ